MHAKWKSFSFHSTLIFTSISNSPKKKIAFQNFMKYACMHRRIFLCFSISTYTLVSFSRRHISLQTHIHTRYLCMWKIKFSFISFVWEEEWVGECERANGIFFMVYWNEEFFIAWKFKFILFSFGMKCFFSTFT